MVRASLSRKTKTGKKAKPGVAPASSGVKKPPRKHREQNFKSYIKKQAKLQKMPDGNPRSIKDSSLEIMDIILRKFVVEIGRKAGELTKGRGSQTVGRKQIELASDSILNKANPPNSKANDPSKPSFAVRAREFRTEKVNKYIASLS